LDVKRVALTLGILLLGLITLSIVIDYGTGDYNLSHKYGGDADLFITFDFWRYIPDSVQWPINLIVNMVNKIVGVAIYAIVWFSVIGGLLWMGKFIYSKMPR